MCTKKIGKNGGGGDGHGHYRWDRHFRPWILLNCNIHCLLLFDTMGQITDWQNLVGLINKIIISCRPIFKRMG